MVTKLWFGTLDRMTWFRAPTPGADSSPQGWESGGTLLGGGGYQGNSWNSHKVYTYAWPDSSTRQEAQMMKSYADGSYGRGLIYFVDPLIFDQNVLPARWADPSMALDWDGPSHVAGVDPTVSVTTNGDGLGLPVQSANYNLLNTAAGFRGFEEAVYLPIPTGYTLVLGAFYAATGTARVMAAPHRAGTTPGPTFTSLPQLANNAAANTVGTTFSDVPGVWLWIGKTATGAGTIRLSALRAKLVASTPSGTVGLGYGLDEYGTEWYGGVASGIDSYICNERWMGGMGHSGTRFIGKPTYSPNSGVNGGQIGFAASFREVGDSVYR